LKGNLVVSGDFNIHVDDISSVHTKHFLDLLDLFGLTQHVTCPTHTQGHTLDLIITRQETSINSILVDVPFYSDHSLVSCKFPATSIRSRSIGTKVVRNWKNVDNVKFKAAICSSALCTTDSALTEPVENSFNIFNSTLVNLADIHAPLRTIKIKDCPLSPWFDGKCHDARRVSRSLEKRYRRSGLDTDRTAWLYQMNVKRNLCREKEFKYWSDRILTSSADPKKLWCSLNSLLLRDGHCKQHSDLTADAISAIFQEKITVIRAVSERSAPPAFKQLATTTLDHFTGCSAEQLRSIILKSPAKSCQLDPIPTTMLLLHLDNLLPYLTAMCNNSLSSGTLPTNQKHAIITPLLKKTGSDPSVAANYRPVSNLSFLSKIIERIIVRQLTAYLTINKLWPLTQSAYRPSHSTETAMLRVTSDIFEAANSSDVTLLAMLDLSAAFDCVDHTILLRRLHETYGIGGLALQWIFSFLNNRTQSVSFNGAISQPSELKCGVPQGSVLGPILFLLYTADAPEIAATHGISCHCYADDIQLYVHCSADSTLDASHRMINCITDINNWMLSNRLKLNPDKTQFAWFGTWQQLCRFTPDVITMPSNVSITPSKCVRNLGCNFDSRLTMEDHVNEIVKSCLFQLRQLRSIRRSLTDKAAAILVHAFISCRLDYCNSILYGVSDRVLHKLQLVQNTAARLIANCRRYDHITPVLRDLHWLPIQQRIKFKLALFVHLCLRGQLPLYLSNMLTPLAEVPHRSGLRSASHGDLMCAGSNLRFGNRSFRHSGPSIWNSLPARVRNPLLSTEQFKRELKTYLFTSVYK
jgi:hypothetical protein